MASVSSTRARIPRNSQLIGMQAMAINLDFGHHSSSDFTVRRWLELAHSRAFIGQRVFQFIRASTFRLEPTAFQSLSRICANM